MTAYFFIVAQHSGKVLDVYQGSTEASAKIIQYTKKSTDFDNQLWSFDNDGYIYNKKSGLVLDVTGSNIQDSTPIIQYQKHPDQPGNQQWVYSDTDNTISLKSNSNYVLDVTGSSQDDGTPIILYHKTGNPNQRFTLHYYATI
ncbi:4472_t:CDS:2 [Ambispora leptoticha]|uniref:4472_t:CDS:1 n=1 Tax=Ambispora leptoticha TaxID=144679 RepID=A0A9N9A5E8_9GLOM|nr:4472_t:CDS:2 [Ambispora leptoticha]